MGSDSHQVGPTESRTRRVAMPASIPVELDLPSSMERSLRKVLAGEYDAPFYGSGLTILDVGANVGAFSVWASMRWPRSRIHAYEPQPGTFAMLTGNVGHLPDVVCTQAAIHPGDGAVAPFFSRFDGDGESGLVDEMMSTFVNMPPRHVIEVPVLHPRDLPPADIVKLDCEGSEAAILEHLDLSATALVMVEYQHLESRERIVAATEGFELVRETSVEWVRLLDDERYRPELAEDRYGVMVLWRDGRGVLRRGAAPEELPRSTSLREVAGLLPSLTRDAVLRRVRRRGRGATSRRH